MTLAPTNEKYSAALQVTDGPFSKARFILAIGVTKQEAKEKCDGMAQEEGWTPPKWWQWWRRNDSSNPYVGRLL